MSHHIGYTYFTITAVVVLSVFLHNVVVCSGTAGEEEEKELRPTLMVATIVRNKAHSLSYFLHYLQRLDYPKDRISLWFVSDHNMDNSSQMLQAWLRKIQHLYHNVYVHYNDTVTDFSDASSTTHWSRERFMHVINLRQKALEDARRIWADYILMLDADAILFNNQTINRLIDQNKTIIAPMLNTTANDHYANFWGAMDVKGYYKRSPNYFGIRERHTQGCLLVAMVHSAVLINLRHQRTQQLAYHPPPKNYRGPFDDIIIFAHSAKYYGMLLYLLNDDFFGFLPYPMEAVHTVAEEAQQFTHIKLESIVADLPLEHLPYLEPPRPPKSKLGFDQVYMINLKRRADRKKKMLQSFEELSISAKYVEAVDGKLLNHSYIESLGIRMLPGYLDPYLRRPLTSGELGCFLSHYFIWKDVIENNYEKILVFEDDIRFEPFFRRKLEILLFDVNRLRLDWDLIYLGRKKLKWKEEDFVEGSDIIVYPNYSYWTLSYILTRGGVDKLMSHNPLQNLLPVDEYIPILFDRHPEDKWKNQFSPRDLKGFSVEPLLVFPTHYTGEPGYFTDTDRSKIINFGTDGNLIKGKDPERERKGPGVKGQNQGLVNDPSLLLRDANGQQASSPNLRGDPAEMKDEL